MDNPAVPPNVEKNPLSTDGKRVSPFQYRNEQRVLKQYGGIVKKNRPAEPESNQGRLVRCFPLGNRTAKQYNMLALCGKAPQGKLGYFRTESV
jgi:hypothetical protein